MSRPGRRVVSISDAHFGAYDLDGQVQSDIHLLEISYDRAAGNGCYLMRMQPGARTVAHIHQGVEDFLILEGDLVDDDGTIFRPGDVVSYAPGTRHSSRTENGCLIAVFEWGKPEPKRGGKDRAPRRSKRKAGKVGTAS